MKHMITICLILLLIPGIALGETENISENTFIDPAPLCFTEEPDYSYEDSQLYIHIKRYEETEQVYHVVDVQISDPKLLKTAFSYDKPGWTEQKVSVMASKKNAVLAINADYIGCHRQGVIIRNGELIRSAYAAKYHLLIIDENGDFSVITDRTLEKPADQSERLMSENVWQTFEFGPLLVKDGEYAGFYPYPFNVVSYAKNDDNPRTGIGQIGPLHYIIIVWDGRKAGYSQGVNLETFAMKFVEHGAQIAFNLDGGGSSTLYFMGEIIHRPSAGYERSVSDMIYFTPDSTLE